MIKQNRFNVEDEPVKEFKFALFGNSQNHEKDRRVLKTGEPSVCFNLTTEDGTLKKGMGIEDFSMPLSYDNLDDEFKINIRGNEVQTLWKLKWYDLNRGYNCYYLFYFNDEGYICYDNLFETRPATFLIPTEFTSTPYATYYRKDGQDAILLSGEGSNLTVITGERYSTSENAPRIINCASHYGKLFAITSTERGVLVYNEDPDVLAWSDEKTKGLDFSDDRGDLNKILPFNDYLYIFRDFGITEISEYGEASEFAISHIYQSSAYIEPNSIAECGEKIYFLEGKRLMEFNGRTVNDLGLQCLRKLSGSQRYAYGECFDGKYYLACRIDFDDDKKVGCENSDLGYKNNALLVYTIESGHVDILRGVDINELLALTNRFKSKLVMCFHNDYIGKIGQLTLGGKLFENNLYGVWESGITDFGMSGVAKRINKFTIQSKGDLRMSISSDVETKVFEIKGKSSVQTIEANVLGRHFGIKIEVDSQENVDVSELVVFVSERQ